MKLSDNHIVFGFIVAMLAAVVLAITLMDAKIARLEIRIDHLELNSKWMNDPIKALTLAAKLFSLIPPRRVMIVEDDSHDAKLLRRYVEDEGWEAAVFKSPSDALDALEDGQRFRKAIVDISFPGDMTGFQFADRLAEKRKWRRIEVTYVTGHAESLSKATAQKHWSFVIKDATGCASLEAVRSVLRNGSSSVGEMFFLGWGIAVSSGLFGYNLETIRAWFRHLLNP